MSLVLLIDQGNTRRKLAIYDATNSSITPITPEELTNYKITAAYIASVGVRKPNEVLFSELNISSDIPLQEITTPKSLFGITVAYQENHRLGVDRWLALLAAFKQAKKACVVIDCGTALTIDVVNKNGMHQGGYILPGYHTTINALISNTQAIKLNKPVYSSVALGQDTEQCVINGVLSSHILLIDQSIKDLNLPANEVCCFVTGGDANLYTPLLKQQNIEFIEAESLVFNGISLYAAHDLVNI